MLWHLYLLSALKWQNTVVFIPSMHRKFLQYEATHVAAVLAIELMDFGKFFCSGVLTSYLGTQLDLAEKAEFSKHGCQYSLRFNAIFKHFSCIQA